MPTPPLTVLQLRGNSEPLDGNMLDNVVRKLDPKLFRVIEINYPASIGPAGGGAFKPSELESVRIGCEMISREVAAAPGPVAIIAYSLGTVTLVEWLKQNPHVAKVVFAGLLANARRKPGRQYGFPLPIGGEGIFGQWIDDKRAWCDIAFPGDVITAMPAGSILRQGSDLIQHMSLVDPIRWANDVIAKLPSVAWQLAGTDFSKLVQLGPKVGEAIAGLDGFARGGMHTARYFEPHWRDWQNKPISAIDLMARCLRNEQKRAAA
ncbi:alpha/beta hydrolase family protein [Tsukamurella tyrosinosolvens]|uniref:hypothetical protein n=1 Tax=Tsukamurella tyrosinosolvens TaxID=57704 RepID=UPI002DD42F85|nr:hypothetical protein [Tsukamurella tyrosinosolvens]MEC4615784.1 hypothetical protein [Tsukamurella tyrosinosolvens]